MSVPGFTGKGGRFGAAMMLMAIIFTLALLLRQVYGGDTRQKHIEEHSRFASLFKAGDSNAPILAMDWFSDHAVYFCRVSQDGRVYSARDTGHAIQGGSGISSRYSLDSTNKAQLVSLINDLPPSARMVPLERQLLVSGVQSNRWFANIYDRRDIPSQVESLYGLTRAYLGWFIPDVSGHEIAHLHGDNFSGSFAAVANDAPIALSFGHKVTNGAYYYPGIFEVWNFESAVLRSAPPFEGVSEANVPWEGVAVSPDGKVAVTAVRYGVYGIDCLSGKLLWQATELDHDSYVGTIVTIAGQTKTFYTAGAHVVERRDLLTGHALASLETNELYVKFLKTSRDGRVMVAGIEINHRAGHFDDSRINV